jgi:hypothetical protein
MKGEDGSRAPWMVMQTWKERPTGSGKKEYPVCLPSYTSGIQDNWILRREAGLENRKFSNLLKLIILAASPHYYGIIQLQVLHGTNPNNNITVLRPMFPNLRQSPTVFCSLRGCLLRRTSMLLTIGHNWQSLKCSEGLQV